MQKNVVIAGVILALGTGSFLLYRKTSASPQAVRYVTSTVSKGTLITSVSGSGNVIVDQITKVNPSISGTVTNLSVKLGDQVKKGQTLFTIVNDQLDVATNKSYTAYLQAKQGLTSAQAQLITTRATYANQTLDSGQAKALAGLDQANQALSTAQAQLGQDQQTLNSTPSSASNYTSLQAKVGTDQAGVTLAQDTVSASSIALQQSQNSVPANIQAARQQVVAAQESVQAAQKNVDTALGDYNNQIATAAQRTVTAPIDGTITTLSISNGDQLGSTASNAATSATAPIVIANLTTLKASVQINEVDAPAVQTTQKVAMTFDAIDGLSLTGKVEKIDTVGTLNQGVVTYAATIDFDSLDSRVRPQMSVSASITTSVKQDVLSVPNAAVKTQNSSKYVQILQNGAPIQQTVGVGVTNDTDTEITSGLSEGDSVVTQTITATASKSPAASSGLGIPGLGGSTGGSGRITGSGRGGN